LVTLIHKAIINEGWH